MDYIEEHLGDAFLLSDVSKEVGVSDWHFRRVFFALTNMTLQEYVKKPAAVRGKPGAAAGGAGDGHGV